LLRILNATITQLYIGYVYNHIPMLANLDAASEDGIKNSC